MDTIRLRNYRCFEDTGEIELKPVTLLVGANSSGKSSLIKHFPLLKQSTGRNRRGVFRWSDLSGVDYNSFSNVVRKGTDTITVEYGINDFHFIDKLNRKKANHKKKPIAFPIRVTLIIEGEGRHFDYLKCLKIQFYNQNIEICLKDHEVERLTINGHAIVGEKEKVLAVHTNSILPHLIFLSDGHFDDESSLYCKSIIQQLKKKVGVNDNELENIGGYARMFNIGLINNKEKVNANLSKIYETPGSDLELNDLLIWYNLNSIIDTVNLYFMQISECTSYVQPIRAMAQRYYRIENVISDEIAPDGTNLAMFLFNLNKDALKRFQKWTYEMLKFKLKPVPSEGHVQLQIQFGDNTIRNLIDVGFGYSQIAPILAIIWNAVENSSSSIIEANYYDAKKNVPIIIAIEQPELHLHPRFICMFADMFASVILKVKKEGKRISMIIETHSEALINRVGELVGIGEKINSEDVNVYLFNAREAFADNEKKQIEKAVFDKNGYLTNWPYGFFS